MPDNPVRVIEFWRAVEIFSPQPLPKTDIRGHVTDLRPGDLMPWEPGSRRNVPPAPGKAWRHEVFGGVYELSRVRDALVELYGEDDGTSGQQAPVRGQSALFSCTVDADGRLVEGTAVLSAGAWAIGRAVANPGALSLAGFDQDAQRYGDDLGILAGSGPGAAIWLLAASMRAAVPDAVAEGVKAAVNVVLAPVAGPLAAAGAALAAGTAGKMADAVLSGTPKRAPSVPHEPAQQEPARLNLNPLRGSDMHRFVAQLAARLTVDDILRPRRVRVRSYQVDAARAEDQTEHSFLNSFYADDLARVARAFTAGGVGRGLAAYLTSAARIDTRERTDVRVRPATVWNGCLPGRIPPGRWAANFDRSLVMSQQFAVNEIMERPGRSGGLLAVNGPPGTGKTTMLRDLVAAIVVARADQLAKLPSPAAAFDGSKTYQWQPGREVHRITPLKQRVTGMEIVVASSNNGAVENVTTEIPGSDGIGSQWRAAAGQLDYFAATAQLVHGEGAWAMIAAKLGNSANRRAFTERFWWGGPDRQVGCMVDLLDRLSDQPSDWRTAKASFGAAREKVQALSAERARVALAIKRVADLENDARKAASDVAAAYDELQSLQAPLQAAEGIVRDARERHSEAGEALDTLQRRKPGVMVSLATGFRAGRDWYAEHSALRRTLDQAQRDLNKAQQAMSAIDAKANAARRARTEAVGRLHRLTAARKSEQELIAQARLRWGDHLPEGPESFAGSLSAPVSDAESARRERATPWADEEFAAARTELFLAALALHKAFISAEAATIKRNLSALMDVLNGKGRPPDRAVLAAWQTFFVVVPVVSTTFASLPALFAGLGRESLGWLFIDEAGQAPPQQAVGAIWRAKRTVVVGDPLQLEPVVTLPWGGQRALLRLFGVEQEWAPEFTSVQRVADRLAPYGTSLPISPRCGSADVWVATPLRVHRRCDRPMFDVSNKIAYDGLMVYGTPEREPLIGRNYWYDVRSADSRGHWIPAEGAMLRQLLTLLRDHGSSVSGVRVISPFRQVAAEAATVHREVFGDVAAEDRKKWVGTVHTMQGKEADVVILVLGGDPNKPAARTFATETPNLLNVAVTRARRRLYVIGNQDTWGKARYFDVLARNLEVWRAHPSLLSPKAGPSAQSSREPGQ